MNRDLKIIVVEDDPLYQAVYVDAISPLQCHLSFCYTISLAVELSVLINPDVIVVDLGLPDGDGTEAITNIRQKLSKNPPFVVVVTGSENPDRHQAALEAGANKVMVKPIDAEGLQNVLRSVSEPSL